MVRPDIAVYSQPSFGKMNNLCNELVVSEFRSRNVERRFPKSACYPVVFPDQTIAANKCGIMLKLACSV